MGILVGFAPWIVYWVLVGNVPFETAVLVALAVAVAAFVIGRVKGTPGRTLEIGAIATFVVLAVLTFTVNQSFMEQWMQPLSNAGIFLVALISVLIGRPFVREFAEVDQPDEVIKSEVFARITTLLTWIWVAAFAGMTVSSAIPPIVYGGRHASSTPRRRCRSSATGSSRSRCWAWRRWRRGCCPRG